MVPVCPKCGIIGRSGKSSCCGRGGSWFGNCGSADNTKVEHRWYEGLEACKTRTQLEAVRGQESKTAQELVSASSNTSIAAPEMNHHTTTHSNMPANTSNGTPRTSGAHMMHVDAITMSDTTETTASANAMPIHTSMANAAVATTALKSAAAHAKSPATTTGVTVASTTTSMLADAAQEATIVSDWIPQSMCHACDEREVTLHEAMPHTDTVLKCLKM